MLNERTKSVLQLFHHIEWFSAVGERQNNNIAYVDSWWDAAQSCSTIQWDNVRVEAQKPLMQALHGSAKERYRLWNEYVEEVKSDIIPLIEKKVGPILVEEYLSDKILDSIKWDIVTIAMCTEYGDIHLPSFYVDLASWYMKGHFPCGWDGPYPQGRLVVF